MEWSNQSDVTIQDLNDIPLLPIDAFKHNIIKTEDWEHQTIFKSSGTTKAFRSQHYIKDLSLYHAILKANFSEFFNEEYIILALLPSYIENGDSSLVEMVRYLSSHYNSKDNFFLYNHNELNERILSELNRGRKLILFGVTFALIDFAEQYKIDNRLLKIIYTGGMKNRKREMDSKTIYKALKSSFPNSIIASEYGMTELSSQAYSINDNDISYKAGRTLRIIPKQLTDPLNTAPDYKTAQLGFIDLANIHSCAFVLTNDLCLTKPNQEFQLLGRMSRSDIRGCHLMYEL